ncbi:hypothetical protein CJP74_01920 [Psittacicella melopsittaci]|uniref:Uncharacterized protein n=1 Tax=Psittacicella melopsittaci TaxID=2028576 RepID=A0A3A1YB73_9GAMM|nr:hypothetical protein [Psittacicella melopsittaci]RIY33367.1 hypothetical protein CJP74_01920 [Psittacicella melopsittaci]
MQQEKIQLKNYRCAFLACLILLTAVFANIPQVSATSRAYIPNVTLLFKQKSQAQEQKAPALIQTKQEKTKQLQEYPSLALDLVPLELSLSRFAYSLMPLAP